MIVIFQVTALIVVPMSIERGFLVGGLIAGGFLFFFLLSKLGERMIKLEEKAAKTQSVTQLHEMTETV